MDIVCIEDNVDFSFFVEKALESIGWNNVTISIYDEGSKALKDMSENKKSKKAPKLVLLDINMPGMSGLDLWITTLLLNL